MATTMMTIDNPESKEAITQSENEDKEESWCPLFSEGLPSDFASNSKLAALASLLNDDSSDDHSHDSLPNDKNRDKTNVVDRTRGILQDNKLPHGTRSNHNRRRTADAPAAAAGGGKAKRGKRRQRKSGTPYDKERYMKNAPAKTATVGEAQLFLNLWKI